MNTHSCTGMLRSGATDTQAASFSGQPSPAESPAGLTRWDCSWREQSSSTGLLWQEWGGKTFLPAWELLDFKIFSWLSSGWEGQTLAFFSKEKPKHILRNGRNIFWLGQSVSHLLCSMCFIQQAKQKQIGEKVISLSKMSVRDVPPNQNFKLVLRKKILL